MTKPAWEYIRVDVLLRYSPKLDGLSYHARWVLVHEMWAYCGQNLTDGFIRDSMWRTFGTPAVRAAIVAAGLAHKARGGYQIHDYLDHQRSRAEAERLTANRKAAGEASARARALAKANAQQTVEQPAEQTAEQSRGELKTADVISVGTGSKREKPDEDDLARVTAEAIRQRTGIAVEPGHASAVAASLLLGRKVANPAGYVAAAIAADPNPRRFAPVSLPPPAEALTEQRNRARANGAGPPPPGLADALRRSLEAAVTAPKEDTP